MHTLHISMKQHQKWLLATVVFLIPKVLIWSQIGNTSRLAPDEEIYVSVLSKIYGHEFRLDSYTGFSSKSEFAMKLILFPAYLLSKFNIDFLWSMRAYSSFLFFITVIMLLKLCKTNQDYILFLVLLLLFPTVHVWTGLGIRESFIYFSLVLIFSSFREIMYSSSLKLHLFLHFLGYFVLINVKTYLAIITFVSELLTCFALALLPRKSRSFSKRKLLKVFILFFSLLPLLVVFRVEIQGQKNMILQNKVELVAPRLTDEDKPIVNERTKLTQNGTQLESLAPATINQPLTYVSGAINFLARPLPFIDSGRPEVNLVAFESLIWLLLYGLFSIVIAICFLEKDYFFIGKHMPAIFFSIMFVLASASLETNIGTASRHRSVLLFVIIPVIFDNTRRSLKNES